MDRAEIDEHIDRLRREHRGREEFVAAVQEFGQTLDPEARKLLGEALLERPSDPTGFDVLREEAGWFRRTMRRIEKRERSYRHREQ